MKQQDKPKTQTTTAKANSENTAMANTIGALSGLSSIQSGKTAAERAPGIVRVGTAIAPVIKQLSTAIAGLFA